MKNLWYLFSVMIVIIIGLIIIGVVLYAKKEKHYILAEIIIIFGVIFLFVESIPYIKDIKRQETTILTAVYDEYQITSTSSPTAILIFKSNGKIYEIISPRIFKIHVKLESGKNYIVEYYNNTKIIKSYTLIE